MEVREADSGHAVQIAVMCFEQRAFIRGLHQLHGAIFKTEFPKGPRDTGSAGQQSRRKRFTRRLVELLLQPVGRVFRHFEATLLERVKHTTRAKPETE